MAPINQGILEGLKHAIARGESLQYAITTFQNAGYPEAEIQAAASALKVDTAAQGKSVKTLQKPKPKIPGGKEPPPPKKSKKVSLYEEPKESIFRNKWFVIILIIALVILLAALGTLFFFRDQFIDFFAKLTAAK